jgi:3-oxoacyl-[acyl-carrier-protein] synthase II
MPKKRVVITGMGVVSCFGKDVDVLYQNLLSVKSVVLHITEFKCED